MRNRGRINTDRRLRAYVIGLAIGDGNLSNPRLYKIRQSPAGSSFKYHVRLSRDVLPFLRLVKPLKGRRYRRTNTDASDGQAGMPVANGPNAKPADWAHHYTLGAAVPLARHA
jgi:hypothetical protein